MDNRELTPPYARYLVHLIRPFPDFDFFFIKPLRRKAVQLLQLKPGDRVLDVGCGPGGSFPYLVDAVGPTGEVVGLEISPEVAINARRRIEKNRWRNVLVIEGDARTVKLQGKFDGVLMFAAADVYASPQSLANLSPSLKNDALRCCLWSQTLTPSLRKGVESTASIAVEALVLFHSCCQL
jgi:tRNA A58 N-methylase Trm61